MSTSARTRSGSRDIADLPVHRVDAAKQARTACGDEVAQTTPEPWEDVPVAERCSQCADAGR